MSHNLKQLYHNPKFKCPIIHALKQGYYYNLKSMAFKSKKKVSQLKAKCSTPLRQMFCTFETIWLAYNNFKPLDQKFTCI